MTRTFVLGIDGASRRIIDDMDLPAFDRLIDAGVRGRLRSILPPMTYPAWKCYSTGKNPGELGVFGFVNFDREQKTNHENDASDFQSAEIWDYLSEAGKRVGVVNMPSTYPPHEVNGIMISGPNSGDSGYVTPPDRETELEVRGYVPLTNGHRLALQSGGETTVSASRELIESRFDVTRELLAEEEFEFFNLTIYCTDPVQHHLWDGPEVGQTYRCLDRELGSVLDQLESKEEEWNVVVVSDHGFRPIDGAMYVDSWLEAEGFLETVDSSQNGTSILPRFGLTTQNAVQAIRALGAERLVGRLPDSVTSAVNQRLPSGGGAAVVDAVDWEHSDVVFLMGGLYVLDEKRRETILDELEDALRTVTIEGDRVFDEIHRTDDVYTGEYTPQTPDLIPIANDHKLLGFSDNGTIFADQNDWIASHEMDGVFIGHGPSFGSAESVRLNLTDVAPTLLRAMEQPVPNDMNGSVQTQILDDYTDTEFRQPIEEMSGREATPSDRKQMEENLRQLGYID
jgi:predicted AlkP superfamily phosphohydrolase/phosphomutase